MSPGARLWIEALPRRWARNGIFAGIFCAHARFEVKSDAGDVVYVVAFSCVLAGLLSLIGAVIGRRTRAELRRLYDVPDDDRAAAIARLPAQFAIRAAVALFIIAFAVVPVFYLLIPAPTDAGRDNLALLGVLAVCLVAGPAIGFFAGACLRANLRMRLAQTPAPSAPQGDAAALPVAVRSGRQTSRNYIARHWRGELSLAVSYWGNTALISITIVLAVAAIMANVDLLSLEPLVYPGSLIAFLLSLTAVAVMVVAWQMVGVWRSASRYRRAGNAYWGGLAQIAVALGVAGAVLDFGRQVAPQFPDLYNIATGDEEFGGYAFRVLPDRHGIELSGVIGFGAAKALERLLDEFPEAKVLYLHSPGGRAVEAQRVGDLVRRRNLAVHVLDECSSACTIVFLSGRERIVGPQARLGFHQPDFAGATPEDRREAISSEQKRLVRLGVSETFAQQAMSAAPDSMWYPSVDDLLREGIVTRLASEQR